MFHVFWECIVTPICIICFRVARLVTVFLTLWLSLFHLHHYFHRNSCMFVNNRTMNSIQHFEDFLKRNAFLLSEMFTASTKSNFYKNVYCTECFWDIFTKFSQRYFDLCKFFKSSEWCAFSKYFYITSGNFVRISDSPDVYSLLKSLLFVTYCVRKDIWLYFWIYEEGSELPFTDDCW